MFEKGLVGLLCITLATMPSYSYTFTWIGGVTASHRADDDDTFFDSGIDPASPASQSVTVIFSLDDSASEAQKVAVENAASTWNALRDVDGITDLRIIVFRDQLATSISPTDGRNAITFNGVLPTGVTFGANDFAQVFTTTQQHARFTSSSLLQYSRLQQLQITDVDIAFNPSPPNPVSTNEAGPAAGQADLESVALHYLGRALGLSVSTLMSSVMYPVQNLGNSLKRTLTQDDRSGMAVIYPSDTFRNFFGSMATHVGHRTRLNPLEIEPLEGGHIVAIDNDTGIIAAAFMVTDLENNFRSGGEDYADDVFHGLPDGDYKMLLEPNDGPLTEADFPNAVGTSFVTTAPGRFLDEGTNSNTGELAVVTNFNNVDPDLVFTIRPGQGDSVVNSLPLFPNAENIAINTLNGGNRPVYVSPGETITLSIGGVGLAADENENQLIITGPDITAEIVAVAQSGAQATVSVTVAEDDTPTTGPEPRAIFWQQAGQLTSLVGGLVVVPSDAVVTSTGGGGQSFEKSEGKNQSNCCAATLLLGKNTTGLFALRGLRDQFLKTTAPGSAVSDFYYSKSPAVAPAFARSSVLNAIGKRLLHQSAVVPAKIALSPTKRGQTTRRALAMRRGTMTR